MIYNNQYRHISVDSKVAYPIPCISWDALWSKRGRHLSVACLIILDLACAWISRRNGMDCARKQSILSGTGVHNDLCWVHWYSAIQLIILHILPHWKRQNRRFILYIKGKIEFFFMPFRLFHRCSGLMLSSWRWMLHANVTHGLVEAVPACDNT